MTMQLNCSGRLLSLEKPVVMGILNVTEDSFFDGGQYTTADRIVARAAKMLEEGADIIDVGAVSTRPGAEDIPENQEISTIKETVELLKKQFPNIIISVDTWRASVAEKAIEAGADIINDISGGTFDEGMIPLIGTYQVPYCLMHTTAKPKVMQQQTEYKDIISDMLHFFGVQLEKLHKHHVHDIIIDPGFGFGKDMKQNYLILKNLNAFQTFGLPILAGVSRKSMIHRLLNVTPQEALNGTTAVHMLALLKGANILRAHDVREAKEAIRIFEFYHHV
ncbi:MAG: dihydropteroate synthase [Bacteroidales bacterium]|nr:dihydropteroate synthase [Bacteroidales bacterium]